MITRLTVLLIALSGLSGCSTVARFTGATPHGGAVTMTSTVVTQSEGKTVTETRVVEYTAPELSDGKNSVEVNLPNLLTANFGNSRDPKIPEVKDLLPQRMIYGAGVLLMVGGSALAWFTPKKRGGVGLALSGAAVIAFGVFIDRLGGLLAWGILALIAAAIVGAVVFVINDLKDGKLDGKLSLKR
jgi:uncharacterized protein YceK